MKLGQNIHIYDKNLLELLFLNFFQNFPIFTRFSYLSPNKAILGQLWPTIPDREYIDMSFVTMYLSSGKEVKSIIFFLSRY